jgi:predicted kinase
VTVTVGRVPAQLRPFVVAVGGIPGSGKTTLARTLADALHVPVLVRDAIKEGLHVTARSDDPAEVHRFADLAFELLFDAADRLVATGVSLVVEAAFHRAQAAADFDAVARRADLMLVWCCVDPNVALARYRARAPQRHPAHADEEYAARMGHPAFDWSAYEPPAGPWPLVRVDTAGPEPSPSLADLCRIVDEARTG